MQLSKLTGATRHGERKRSAQPDNVERQHESGSELQTVFETQAFQLGLSLPEVAIEQRTQWAIVRSFLYVKKHDGHCNNCSLPILFCWR